MREPGERVALVTGASSGIGRACAALLAQRRFRVYGTSRRPSLDQQRPFAMLEMNVAEDASVTRGVAEVLRREGRLDIVVNNAGVALAGPVECTSSDEARRLFEVNFFGVLRVCRAALPVMRAQGEGYVVNVGSIAGRMAVPHQAMYCASKFALEGLSEALRLEVGRWGVRVVLIEPGDHRTGMTAARQFAAASGQAPAYAADLERAVGRMAADEQNGAGPERVARLVLRVVTRERPRLRYPVGPPAQRAAVWAKRLLPEGWTEWGVRRYYGLE